MRASSDEAPEALARPGRSRRALAVAARWLGTCALLALTLSLVDLGGVGARLAGLDPLWLAAALALSVPLYLLLALRWCFTAGRVGAPLRFRRAVAEYYASTFLNRVMPLSIAGDAVRVMRHRRRIARAGVERSLGLAVRAALLDRVSGQCALGLIMGVAAAFWLAYGYSQVVPFAVAGALVLGGTAVVALAVGRRRFGSELAQRLVQDGKEALVRRGALGVQLGLSTTVVAVMVAMFYCAGRATGSDLDLASVVQIAPLVLGSTFIPVAFSGWGAREATAAALFGVVGLDPEAGVAVAVTFGLLGLVTAAPGLLVLLWPAAERGPGRPASRVQLEPLLYALWFGAGVAASAMTRDVLWFSVFGLAGIGARVVFARGTWTPRGTFGVANALTSLRVLLAAALPLALSAIPRPAFVGLVLAFFALDGLDGWLARRRGTASPFGAVYDTEADAYLVMTLCLLLWVHGVTGPWVLIAGLWRYIYAAVVAVVPAAQAAPRSLLGRWVYAILMVSLAGAFLPVPPFAASLAALGTVLVTMSFLRSFSLSLGRREAFVR